MKLTVLILALLFGALPAGPASAAPAGAAPAIIALTSGKNLWSDPVPADYPTVMGYRPVLLTDAMGRPWWVSPRGGCSAPTGATQYDFSLPCKAHDLGYDLLRYAAATGHPLGPWARQAVDAAFGRALARRCDVVRRNGCSSAAAIYHDAVVFNSWRQDWSDPRPEPALPWILLATGLTLAPVLVNAAIAALTRAAERRRGSDS